MALLGGVGITLQQLLQVTGQVHASAGLAAFLASTAPAFLVVLAALFLGEPLSRWQVVGVCLATVGAGVVSEGGDWLALIHSDPGNLSNLLVLLSAVVWAVFSLLNRGLGRGRPAVLFTSGMMAFGSLFTLPLFIARKGWIELSGLSPSAWGSLFIITLLSTALAYLLYTHALKLTDASRLAAIQNLEPLIAVLAAIILLGEVVTSSFILGGAAILTGVYLAERGRLT